MNHVDITMADTRLIADLGPENWKVRIVDLLTGEEAEILLEKNEFGSLVALMVGEDWSEKTEKDMYEKISCLPANLRPIP